MNIVATSSPLLRAAPLILRLGMAGVLIYGGWEQLSQTFAGETGETLSADAQGVAILANWNSVIGGGQCFVGLFLLLGLLTRAVSLAVVGGVGYAAYAATNAIEGETANIAVQSFDASPGAMLLLAAGCASLLISGAGCLGLDCRGKSKSGPTESAEA